MQKSLQELFGPPQVSCPLPMGRSPMDVNAPGGKGAGGTGVTDTDPCDAQRIVMVGGALQQLLVHPSVRPFEQVFRKKPTPGIYRALPNRTFTFEIGAFTVPVSMMLAVAEWNFHVYRFHGAYAAETVLLDKGLCSLNIGTDFNIDQMRMGQVAFELIPINPTTMQAAFVPVQTGGTIMGSGSLNPSPVPVAGVPTNYSGVASMGGNSQNAFVPGAGIGSALMPYTDRNVQGPERMPFTYYARENQAVQLRISVYKPVRIPIAYFETRISGYLIPSNTIQDLLKSSAPCTSGSGV